MIEKALFPPGPDNLVSSLVYFRSPVSNSCDIVTGAAVWAPTDGQLCLSAQPRQAGLPTGDEVRLLRAT